MSYASKTQVPIDRSQGEIRRILERYSAHGFAFGEQGDKAVVMFQMNQRMIKFIVPMPVKPKPGATEASCRTHQQICRSRWRGLVLAIKAKLECVESGISSFEQEFMAQILLPNGKTVGEAMTPQIQKAYSDGKMPPLLGYGP